MSYKDVRNLIPAGFLRLAIAALMVVLFCSEAHAGIYDTGIALPRSVNAKELEHFLETVHQKALDYGIRNFTPYSLMLVKQARDAIERGEYDAAHVLAKYACTLSPDLSSVETAQAITQWRGNRAGLLEVAQNSAAAFVKSLSPLNIEDFSMAVFENAAVLTGSILLTFCAIALLLLLAHLALFYHDLRHAFSDSLPDISVWAMVGIIFLLPLACRLSIVWLCAWLIVLLFNYTTMRERQVIKGFFVLLAIAIPLLAGAMGFGKFMAQNETLRLLWKANYGYCDARDTDMLEKQLDRLPNDSDVLLSLGLVYKKEGGFGSSQKYYEKLLSASPANYQAAINLGNVYFAQHNWDDAVKYYMQATATAPSKAAAAYFNLSRVYQSKFMFGESEQALNNAKRLDLPRVSAYLKDVSDHYNRMTIDETVAVSSLWLRGFNLFMDMPAYTRDVWRCTVGGIAFPYGPFGFMILAMAAMFIAGRDRLRIAVRCKLCGKAMCRRCQRSAAADLVCAQCRSLLRRQSMIGYGVREDKMNRIKSYITRKRITAAVLGYALPGAGHFLAGQTIVGTAVMLVFFMLVLKAAMPLLFEGPWSFLLGFRFAACAVYGALLLLYWCSMALCVGKIQNRSTEENLLLKIVA